MFILDFCPNNLKDGELWRLAETFLNFMVRDGKGRGPIHKR